MTVANDSFTPVTEEQRIDNRRQYFANDFLASDVVLTDDQSAKIDQICETFIPITEATALGYLVKLGPTDRAAVCELMKTLPQTNNITNYRNGTLR